MTDTTITSDGEQDLAEHADHDHADHPTENAYWIAFAVLGFLTAIEVAWHYMGFSGAVLVWPLVLMMVAKFIVVAGIFMHLKFDLSIRNGNVFSYVFAFGLVLALIVYAVLLITITTS